MLLRSALVEAERARELQEARSGERAVMVQCSDLARAKARRVLESLIERER